MNLFVFLVPVFPLLVVAWYYSLQEERYDASTGMYISYRENMSQHLLYAEIGGVVLFFILLATYFSKLYRRWYSLPEA